MKNLNLRAWHKEEKSMYPVLEISFDYEEVTVKRSQPIAGHGGCCFDEDRTFIFKEVILMQSTGLKDSNGVEIFEGDIVLQQYGVGYETKRYPSFANNTQRKDKKLVSIKDGVINPFFGKCNDFNFYKEFEVLGNIYEQPELLEVGNPKSRSIGLWRLWNNL